MWSRRGAPASPFSCDWAQARLGLKRCSIFEGGKADNILHAYQGAIVVFFDIPREHPPGGLMHAMELIENGRFLSGEYHSQHKFCQRRPHVVVFASWPPPPGRLSHDRLDPRTIWKELFCLVNGLE